MSSFSPLLTWFLPCNSVPNTRLNSGFEQPMGHLCPQMQPSETTLSLLAMGLSPTPVLIFQTWDLGTIEFFSLLFLHCSLSLCLLNLTSEILPAFASSSSPLFLHCQCGCSASVCTFPNLGCWLLQAFQLDCWASFFSLPILPSSCCQVYFPNTQLRVYVPSTSQFQQSKA